MERLHHLIAKPIQNYTHFIKQYSALAADTDNLPNAANKLYFHAPSFIHFRAGYLHGILSASSGIPRTSSTSDHILAYNIFWHISF